MGDVIDLFPTTQERIQAIILDVQRIEYRPHLRSDGRHCVAQVWITAKGPHVAALLDPKAAIIVGKGLITCAAGNQSRSYERDDKLANTSNDYTIGNARVSVSWSFPSGDNS